MRPENERPVGVVANLSPLIAMLLSAGAASLLAPLVFWFIYRDRSAFVRACSAQAFNFTLLMWIGSVAGWVLVFTVILSPLGIILIAASTLMTIVFPIIGAMRANRGEVYRYPMQWLPVLT
ncbi:MAG: DUF4870 domain-containing protein [Bowdeniella nasicola]|nr:DUF4870 domain-containing protein [Bowdeniella nasicola]